MKTAKKIVWVALALLPLISFVWLLLGQIGQAKQICSGDGVTIYYVPIWEDVIIEDIGNSYYIKNLDDGLEIMTNTSVSLLSFVGFNPAIPKNTVLGAFCGIYNILMAECYLPCNAPTFFSMLYMFYLAFLELVWLLIDFILFIPRKCGEIFR